MAISVNPVTKVITVPQSYLTAVSAGLYELDTDQFRQDLRAWEATEAGRTEDRTHDHNPEYTVAGETYARKVELINGYSWQLENTGTFYSCRLSGSNNNLFDVANGVFLPHANVMLIPNNSAGLQTVNTGGTTPALTAEQSASLLEIINVSDIVDLIKAQTDRLTFNISDEVAASATASVDNDAIRDAVWNKPITQLTDSGTIGGFIAKKVIDVKKFLGLK